MVHDEAVVTVDNIKAVSEDSPPRRWIDGKQELRVGEIVTLAPTRPERCIYHWELYRFFIPYGVLFVDKWEEAALPDNDNVLKWGENNIHHASHIIYKLRKKSLM
ncbi:hypothetical protein KIN20_033653 [Parelaphostrongylus tenuis]|uniref:Uncharacterized protein n=1 Tax=Parelaphostrongylus tenuis TaxID=148309 RepID=A0AAD5R927_PARTN|nr:hypothetical protein KIN20_033653 [Parelaphostrongylus tenuis]